MNNKNNDNKAFVRATSNVCSITNRHQINLPTHLIKKMKWDINDSVVIKTVCGKDVQNYIMIEREK
mgnify:CR=1 FL=1